MDRPGLMRAWMATREPGDRLCAFIAMVSPDGKTSSRPTPIPFRLTSPVGFVRVLQLLLLLQGGLRGQEPSRRRKVAVV